MANAADKVFKLNTGAEIPALGLGTWQSDTGLVKDAVSYALSIGYKHIDCGSSSKALNLVQDSHRFSIRLLQ